MKSNQETIIMSNSMETLEISPGGPEVNIARVQFGLNVQETFSTANRLRRGLRFVSNRAARSQRVFDEVEECLRNVSNTLLKRNVSTHCHFKCEPRGTEASRAATLTVNKGGENGPGDGNVKIRRCSFPVPASSAISRNKMHFSPTWTVRPELKKVRERSLYWRAAHKKIPSDPAVWIGYQGFGESFGDAQIAQLLLSETALRRRALHAALVCVQEFEQNKILEVARLNAIEVKVVVDKRKEIANQNGAKRLGRMKTDGVNVDVNGDNWIGKNRSYFKFKPIIKNALVKKSKSRAYIIYSDVKQNKRLIENIRIIESNGQVKMDSASVPQII